MKKKIKKLGKIAEELNEGPKVKKESQLKKTKIKVIGIGGGGGNIVSELTERVKKVSFLAANTDLAALKQLSKKVKPFLFGQNFTSGLGTGMNPELAETAAQNEKERIKKIFQGQDLVIFIACLGGGTGSGATPVLANLAKNQNLLTYGIFTLPFKFEGERKMEIAKMALENLRPRLNAMTIIPNERIFQIIDKTTPLKEALSVINKRLAQSLGGLIETIYRPGLINIDFADLRTILEGRGRLAYLNTLSFPRKEGTAKEVVEKSLSSPLYPYGIKGAKGVLFNIIGEKGISLEEISQISKAILEKANPEAKIIFGVSPGEKYQNIIKTTIFATGLSIPKVKKFRQRKIKRAVEKREESAEGKKSPEESKPPEQGKSKKKVSSPPSFTRPKLEKKEKKAEPSPEVKTPTEVNPNSAATLQVQPKNEKIRKNALQLKKEIEEEEKKLLEKEKFWERPAFLRKKI